MVGAVWKRVGMAALVVCASVLAVEAAAAGEATKTLPFLADGAEYPLDPVPSVTIPERVFGTAGDNDRSLLSRKDDPADDAATDRRPAFPNVLHLLDEFPDADLLEGHFTVRGTPDVLQRAGRLAAAVERGYARDLRVEISVWRSPPPGLSVESLLNSAGDALLLRCVQTTRPEAVVVEDGRGETTFPAALSISALSIYARNVTFRTGPRVAFRVSHLDGQHLTLDVDLSFARVVGERALESEQSRIVVPRVAFVSFRGTVPLADADVRVIRRGDLVVATRVRRVVDATTRDMGVRSYVLPARRTSLAVPIDVRLGLCPIVREPIDVAKTGVTHMVRVPLPWTRAAERLGVRLTPVPPSLVIAEGDEALLVQLDDVVDRERASRGDAFVLSTGSDGAALRVPTMSGRSWTIVDGVLEPVAVRVQLEVQDHLAEAAVEPAFDLVGTVVHGAWQDGTLSVTTRSRSAPKDAARPVRLRRSLGRRVQAIEVHPDTVDAATTSDSVRVLSGETLDDGTSLLAPADWR